MADQLAAGRVVGDGPWQNHRIVGYVSHAQRRGINPHLDVPLISHVKDGLWQGGCQDGVRLPDEFDFVLSLYKWERYDLGPTTFRREVTMYDALDQGFEQIEELAENVNWHLDSGRTVLVHCQAGCNRSGLLAATALVKQGMKPSEAIGLLRAQRSPLVLCNEAFENWVMGLA